MIIRVPMSRLALAGILLFLRPAFADIAPPLRHDPFRTPPPDAIVETTRSDSARDEPFEPILRSTIARGHRSLVNLGGEILAVGEESHGYRLLEVSPYAATFKKDGERIVIEISRARKRTP